MKKHKNLVIFGMIFALSLLITVHSTNNLILDSNTHNEKIERSLKGSGYLDLSGTPISIIGNLGWEEAATNEPWCEGSGTPGDPYIIENVIINGNGIGDCIYIETSDVYFIIRNCEVYNSGNTNNPPVEAGIRLYQVDNGQLIENTCYYNGHGIKLIGCNNMILKDNYIRDNYWWGIDFGWYHLSGSNNIISGNMVIDNFAGISGGAGGSSAGVPPSDCSNNLISENVVDGNAHYGIILGQNCFDNVITENLVINNGFGGIGASSITLGGHDNLVFLNYLSNNYRNAQDMGDDNMWDDGAIGNYWHDYGGVDADGDNIGDTPYLIWGASGSSDYFPIWDYAPYLNTPPTIDSVTGPLDPVKIGDPVQITIDFTDPDEDDTHMATFEWGDEEIDAVNVDPGARTITYTHPYTVAGVHTLMLTITDNGEESDSLLYQYIVIYDPDGGFVTGGGWIDSPAGAFPADIDLTGKANFGFVSKYKKGGYVPIGNTEFLFNAADLNFHSTSYDWLIIAGFKAMFKGTGTINGEGNYGFMLTAIDGEISGGADQFRIKIWDTDNNDAIIYDNNAATDLGGGNIKLHLPNKS